MNTRALAYLFGSSGERISEKQDMALYLNEWVLLGTATFFDVTVPAYGGILEGPYGEVLMHEKFAKPIDAQGSWITLESKLTVDAYGRDKPEPPAKKKRWR